VHAQKTSRPAHRGRIGWPTAATRLRRLTFWALLPLVLPQALWVRSRAPRFAPAAGPRSGEIGTGRPLSLLALGDSIVAGVGAGSMDQALAGATARALADRGPWRITWRSLGLTGAGIHWAREQARQLPQDQAIDVVVISIGINDVTGLVRSARWNRALEDLLAELHDRFPRAVVAVLGLPPLHRFPLLPWPLNAVLGLRARTFDALAQRAASVGDRRAFVALQFEARPEQFAADGYHPDPRSYGQLGEAVAAALQPKLSVLMLEPPAEQ
jgi:lysophospholipase L1-like esterase